jgi:hypothetical protein
MSNAGEGRNYGSEGRRNAAKSIEAIMEAQNDHSTVSPA